MAFTDVEISEAHEAINTDPSGEDMCKLGLIYSTAMEDRPTDYVEAHKWFNLAAMMGDDKARDYRQQLTDEMSKEQVSAALRSARDWLLSKKH